MRLSEIHTAIESGQGPALPEDQAFATLVAIEHLARIEGVPVSALDFTAPEFGAKYRSLFPEQRGPWRGQAQYLSWRNLILNAQMCFNPGDVDADPWASLGRAERLWKKKEHASFYDLYLNIPSGTHPREVTDALLRKAHEAIPAEMEIRLRAGLNSFRRLFQNDLAIQSGLLPEICPNAIPASRNHRKLANMSPDIETWRNRLKDRVVIRALDYLNRLAVSGGRLNGKTDSLHDLRVALCDLPNPAEVGVASINPQTLRNYTNIVLRALGGPDPRKTPAEQAWADLRAAARAAGCETSALWAVSTPAAAQGLFPAEVSETVALELMRSYQNKGMWSIFRQGCEQFDALRGRQVPPDLLPPSPLGIKRASRVPKPALTLDPVKIAWADLYTRLRAREWNPKQISVLSYLRVRACAAGIKPGTLSKDFIGALERDITNSQDRIRLRAAVLCISELSKESGFAELPLLSTPEDRRFSHGGAGEQARTELEELLEFMNAAAPTRRNFRVAVGVVTDAMGRPDITLKDILRTDLSAYDLCEHEPRRKIHTKTIRNLLEFIELPWTPAWRDLQKVVTGTGITPRQNPVPKVLSWKPGIDPKRVKLEWAQRLDRDLRSTLKNPPHGRADLALTLARHLKAFDALHDIPAVAESGLLPPRIGPIR